MSLFSQKPKPFQHATISFKSLTQKRKRPTTNNIKKSQTSKHDDDDGDELLSSDEDVTKHGTHELSTDSDVELITINERDVDHSKSIVDKNNQVIEIKKKNTITQQEDDYDIVEDEFTKSAKLLLQKVDKTKQKINTTSCSNSNTIEINNMKNKTENIDHFIIPKVLSASERLKEKEKLVTLNTMSRNSTSNGIQSCIKIITKLNGIHEWKWLIPNDDLFGKFRSKFAEVYLLPSNSFNMLFDGEKIQDNQICRDLGITDNDIIDVKVSPALFHEAVESAKSFKNISTTTSSAVNNIILNNDTTSANNLTSIQSTTSSNIVDGIHLTTRLNGTHVYKWYISKSEAFAKLRKSFSEIYNLSIDKVKFVFDGEKITDKDTPNSLDMEDNNMIDVKIDPSLVTSAVAFATSKNTTSANNLTSIHTITSSNIVDGIHLTTRLNGTHVYKWYISKSEAFAKLRKSFSETYNLSIDKVKFVFDGEKITDKDTPNSLDMEDNNMIDVKIDKGLYDKAVLSANVNKK